jgi:putative endonuclease
MAGLVPAIHAVAAGADAGRPGHHHDQPPQRHPRHRRHLRYRPSSLRTSRKFSEGFTKRYGVKRLVYREFYETIAAAILRESNMRHWPRARKAQLIVNSNPGWLDLFETWNQ